MKRARKINLMPRRKPSDDLAFTSDQLWRAVDEIAMRLGISVSRLSINAGLDASALNKSKRCKKRGQHWLSVESLSRILDTAKISVAEFAEILEKCK